jgi:CRP/FNR family transcriptional regulator, polysaccharide utilization system transcription regulator
LRKSIDTFTSCSVSPYECKCFEFLSDEQQALITENSVTINFKKGEIICKQGAFASHVLFVAEGLVKAFLDDKSNQLVLKIITKGNFLGLGSVSEDQNTFRYSAMAYVDTVINQIDINIFRRLLIENSKFAKEVIDILSANSAQIYGRFFCLTYKQSYGRLADIILCIADRIFKQTEFELPLSRKDLADLTGMSPETVIRLLKKFREEGMIAMEGKKFMVLDHKRLKRISETG